jgi:hypothetical protein
MKLTILSALTALVLLSTANTASATAKFTNPAGGTAATTILNGIEIKPSTSVGLSASATDVAFAAAAKHETGGTSMYGMTSSDVTISIRKDMDKATPVTSQTSATSLTGFTD